MAKTHIENLNTKVQDMADTMTQQHKTIMELQSQMLQLQAIVQNHGRFLRAGDSTAGFGYKDEYDILDPENEENLRDYIKSTIKSDAWVSMTVKLEGLE